MCSCVQDELISPCFGSPDPLARSPPAFVPVARRACVDKLKNTTVFLRALKRAIRQCEAQTLPVAFLHIRSAVPNTYPKGRKGQWRDLGKVRLVKMKRLHRRDYPGKVISFF